MSKRAREEVEAISDHDVILKQVTTLLSQIDRCEFSCWSSKSKETNVSFDARAIRLALINPTKKERNSSVYLSTNPYFRMKKDREWIETDNPRKEDAVFMGCLEAFLRAVPVTVWMEFLIAINKIAHPWPMPMHHTDPAELQHVGNDHIFQKGSWVSLRGLFQMATYSIVLFMDSMKGENIKDGYYLAITFSSSRYVYFPVTKDKARALCQVVRDSGRRLVQHHACFPGELEEAERKFLSEYVDFMDNFLNSLEQSNIGFAKI